jgi:hypothetical protein
MATFPWRQCSLLQAILIQALSHGLVPCLVAAGSVLRERCSPSGPDSNDALTPAFYPTNLAATLINICRETYRVHVNALSGTGLSRAVQPSGREETVAALDTGRFRRPTLRNRTVDCRLPIAACRLPIASQHTICSSRLTCGHNRWLLLVGRPRRPRQAPLAYTLGSRKRWQHQFCASGRLDRCACAPGFLAAS